MHAGLDPTYEGYYGQLILGHEDLTETGELKDLRRAAREAGERLGWKVATRLVDGRLFVLDQREVPEEIERLAGDSAAVAVDRTREEALRPRPTDS
ncbi:hypothetical protein [Streptomyces parvulus]|uniref:hypothetical protein n=1 Tax=Streptomyces parvulus TaxID=146923 RepID=UPI0034174FC7